MKLRFFVLLIFCLTIRGVHAQLSVEDMLAIKGSLIIYYDVIYESELTPKMTQSNEFIQEMIIVFQEGKMIKRYIRGKKSEVSTYSLYDYSKEKRYTCYEYSSGYKHAVYEKFMEPSREVAEIPGAEKDVLGLSCKAYEKVVNGRSTTIYLTKDLGIDYKDNLNLDGMMMEWSAYSKSLGHHRYVARSMEPIAIPESMYRVDDFTLKSKEEYQKQVKKSQEDYRVKKEKFAYDIIGRKITPFRMVGHFGEKLSSKKLKGKVIVLNFYFKECKPCIMEAPYLNELKTKYEGKEVVFIAITFDENYKVDQFIRQQDFQYTVAGNQRSYISAMKITSYPTNMVVSRKGTVEYASMGYKTDIVEALSFAIDQELKKTYLD